MSQNKIDIEVYKKHFRVAIFGSARIKEYGPSYQEIYKLAHMLASENIDIVTGGGPGIMKAANKGHKDGRKSSNTHNRARHRHRRRRTKRDCKTMRRQILQHKRIKNI